MGLVFYFVIPSFTIGERLNEPLDFKITQFTEFKLALFRGKLVAPLCFFSTVVRIMLSFLPKTKILKIRETIVRTKKNNCEQRLNL